MSKGVICQLLLGFCFGEATNTQKHPTKAPSKLAAGCQAAEGAGSAAGKNMRKVASDLFIFLINLERLEAREAACLCAGLAVSSS